MLLAVSIASGATASPVETGQLSVPSSPGRPSLRKRRASTPSRRVRREIGTREPRVNRKSPGGPQTPRRHGRQATLLMNGTRQCESMDEHSLMNMWNVNTNMWNVWTSRTMRLLRNNKAGGQAVR